MSLDVYLSVEAPQVVKASASFTREGGSVVAQGRQYEIRSTEVFWYNITHNLGKMAREAGIYEALWRPEEIGITKASQLIEPLQAGLIMLQAEPERFTTLNPENGWGSYEGLVDFVVEYLNACLRYPDADVSVSR